MAAPSPSEGARKIEWARDRMGILRHAARDLKRSGALSKVRVGMALHVEAKTAVLALTLQEAGATVALASCNPLSTDDDVAEALRDEYGLATHARKGEDVDEYYANLQQVAALRPEVAVDDGADLTQLLHRDPLLLRSLRGICEETTTGVLRARAMARSKRLRRPVIDVNGAQMKHLFDNRYGTGQSVIDGLMRATNLSLAGKTFLVAGYGWCGRGVAMRARGMGAQVMISEVDPIRAIEARYDGFEVGRLRDLLPRADLVVTATGDRDVVSGDDILHLKDGAILANAGHFNVEISLPSLERFSRRVRARRRHLTEYALRNGRRVYLVSEGRLVNLAAGDGHPVEIMDASFGLQALCAAHLAQHGRRLKPQVYPVPPAIDQRVAHLALRAAGLQIDRLSARQARYLSSFEEGT